MTLEQLQTYLVSKSVTWPIRAHELPTGPDKCIAIRGYSGQPGRLLRDNGLPADDYPRFQILTRDKDDLTAEAMANELHRLLHVRFGDVGGAKALNLQAEQRPAYMMRDESNRYIYVFNCAAWVLMPTEQE